MPACSRICILKNGRIIVIEGIDKVGKTTQSKLLMEFLRHSGKSCSILTFPDYNTPIGSEIRAFLDCKREYPTELKHMLLSANRWEKKKEIEIAMESGTILIMNRYYQSNLVYGVSNGLDLRWLLNLDQGIPMEDLVIILKAKPYIIEERLVNDHDLFEKDQKLLLRVHKNYHELAKLFNWKEIDGERSRKQVHEDVLKLVQKVLVN
jgi:dTMP kinase